MVPKLKKKLGALKFTCKAATYNAKIKLAHGCIMSSIIYGIKVWGLHCRPTVLKRVQSIQTNTLKWITGNYGGSLRDLLSITKWLSVYQLAIYHSMLLFWKVTRNGRPDRLVRRITKSEGSEARIQLTERVWSRTAERFYRRVENLCNGVTRISLIKKILCLVSPDRHFPKAPSLLSFLLKKYV